MAARPDGAVAPRPRRRELLEWYASQAGMSASDLDQMGQRRELEPPTHVDADADSDGEGVEGVQLPEKEPPQGWASWSRGMLGAAYVYAVGESGPSVETAPEASSIDELLAQHAPSIELLRQCMAADPLFEPDRHDSLWLLRFFLSHKDVARAGEAARRALGIRKQQHLDEIGAIVRSCPPQEWPVYGVVQELAPITGVYRWWPDTDGSMLHLGRASDMDMHRLLADRHKFMVMALWGMEYTFQAMDALSRRTGRICKYVRMIDVHGYSLRSINLRFVKLLARQQGDLADLYPQLMGATYLTNMPSTVQTIWNNLKYLAPPRVLAKTDLLDTSNPADKAKIEQWVSHRHLPTFMGGETDVWPPPEPTDSLQDCEARAAAAGGPSLTAGGTSEHKP